MARESKETPIQIAIKAMQDEDGTNGKRLTIEQIANKYFNNDKTRAAFAIGTARQYVAAFAGKSVDITDKR